MAQGKKIVNVYTEWIEIFEALPDDQAGKLIKHFFRYVNDLDPEPETDLINIAFIPIKQQLKRDLKKWLDKSEKNRENANKRWHADNANACERIKPNAKNADKDKVEDKVKDKVEVKEEEIKENNVVEFSENDIQFRDFLCKEFNISEMTQPRQFMDINQAIMFMNNQPEKINKHFRAQCWNYFTYKEAAEEKKHSSINTFLFDPDQDKYYDRIMGGGWNKSNWYRLGKKISKSKYYEEGEDPEEILNYNK